MAVAPAYRFAREYRRSQVDSARPTELILMLYDAGIRNLCLAQDRLQANDIGARHEHLLRAQSILANLIGSLDQARGGDVAANLLRLYTYMYRQLVEANVHDDARQIDEVVRMLRDLRESWEEVDAIEARAARTSAVAA